MNVAFKGEEFEAICNILMFGGLWLVGQSNSPSYCLLNVSENSKCDDMQ